MKAELIDVMGDDLRVVNAARVSFDKESHLVDGDDEQSNSAAWFDMTGQKLYEQVLSERDQKLLNYLAKHGHWTPFSHVMITMRETVPIFVARQRFKHMVGFTYNEVSRRYVSDEPSFFEPDGWRRAAENKKQGSSDEIITHWKERNDFDGYEENVYPKYLYEDFIRYATELYNEFINQGIAPEQARMILPQSMYTSYYVTGSLAAWARAYKLRIDPHAQKEIQDLAKQWGEIMDSIPSLQYSWKALTQ